MCVFGGERERESEIDRKISLIIMVSGFHCTMGVCVCVCPVTWILAVFTSSSAAVPFPILIVLTLDPIDIEDYPDTNSWINSLFSFSSFSLFSVLFDHHNLFTLFDFMV